MSCGKFKMPLTCLLEILPSKLYVVVIWSLSIVCSLIHTQNINSVKAVLEALGLNVISMGTGE